MLREAQNQI
jgi:predicted nuclease with TOPRIM domain